MVGADMHRAKSPFVQLHSVSRLNAYPLNEYPPLMHTDLSTELTICENSSYVHETLLHSSQR